MTKIPLEWADGQPEKWLAEHGKLFGLDAEPYQTQTPDEAWKSNFERIQSRRDSIFPEKLSPYVSQDFVDTLQEAKSLLRKGLIAFGGWGVVQQPFDWDLARILNDGVLIPGADAVLVRGKPSNCHDNALELWLAQPNTISVMTGHALSDDGLWREHSWVIQATEDSVRIVETTDPRLAYFGFTRTYSECAHMAGILRDHVDIKSRLQAFSSELNEALAKQNLVASQNTSNPGR